jgi:lipoprotein-anchoring transpeptidase ErfK/SrfK
MGGRIMVASVVFAFVLGAVPVSALTIQAPTVVTGPADVTVRLDAGEPTGTVTLRDGAAMVGEETGTVDGLALFPALTLASGNHTLRATLVGSDGGTWTSDAVPLYAWGAPGAPTWSSPKASTVVSPLKVSVKAGAATATMTLTLNGRVIKSLPCRPGQTVVFGSVKLAKGANTLAIEAVSLSGDRATFERTAKRKQWPYKTCIVIDKSDYRLYWVKNQQLVKTYKIAHGRHNWTPVRTWRILAKYKTSPRSVYGPRKMRLFKRAGHAGHYRWIYTAYAIHGTNQPWVIGTQASHGCIRMYNRDVLELWPQVRLGTYVITRR